MQSFVQFEDLLEARHFFCTCAKERKDKDLSKMNYPEDETMTSSPNEINFKVRNYTFKNVFFFFYVQKRFRILKLERYTKGNWSYVTKQELQCGSSSLCSVWKIKSIQYILRLVQFSSDSQLILGYEVQWTIFNNPPKLPKNFFPKVDPDEIKIARPGLPVEFTIKFQAPTDVNSINGMMVFLTCFKSTYYRFMIPIKCNSTLSDVTLEPQKVNFGTIPIWKVGKGSSGISRFVKVNTCSFTAYDSKE